VTVNELDVEIHFPKEGVVLSRESRSSEKFMHGIKVLMAKNYIDNLSKEARKGQQEKAEQGIWPTKTPLGYRDITGQDGKKVIAVCGPRSRSGSTEPSKRRLTWPTRGIATTYSADGVGALFWRPDIQQPALALDHDISGIRGPRRATRRHP
jgi:hypothetical protein